MTRCYVRLSEAARTALWLRWQRGETAPEISVQLGCHASTVSWHIARAGGLAPRVRQRAAHHLSLREREELSRGLALGEGVRALARRLGRAPSTISREIARHSP